MGQPVDFEFFGRPIKDIIKEYTDWLETAETTTDNCSCEWLVHQDDQDKPKEEQRLRRGEGDLWCPAHTREGLLLGFFIRLVRTMNEAEVPTPR